jgi:hypothetical protein
MHFPFASLPFAVRHRLLIGGAGKPQLLETADAALGCARAAPDRAQALELLARELVAAALESAPLDGDLAAQALDLHAARPFLDPVALALAREAREHWQRPEQMRYYARILERRDQERIFAFLDGQRDKEPGNRFWLQQAMAMGLYEGRTDWLLPWLDACEGRMHPALLARLRADAAFCDADWAEAADGYAAAVNGGLPGLADRLGEALLRHGLPGCEDAALEHWRDVLALRPWNANLLLRLHDLRFGLRHETAPLEGGVAVFLYTFNKTDELDQTLEALADAGLEGVRLRALDNGSRPETGAVLRGWQDRLGEAMRVVSLPVNVGAAAARNWLARLEDVQGCAWAAYLDDDALAPPDWLGRLGAAVRRYPDAGVWGCRVLDHANPAVHQSVDLHLVLEQGREEPEPRDLARSGQRRFSVSDLHHQELEFGQFAYLRPCASVTGCCHLFRLPALREGGGFDLRFSPSQYDDLDHDLRLCLEGRFPAYQGHLAVRHMKRTGKASWTGRAEYGNAYANMYKLQMKYSGEQVTAMREAEDALLLRDLEEKAAALAGEGAA